MASASILHSEEEFLCSICLDVFTDPITTPCGHNYCNTCITQYWDGTDVCQCPLCKETFDKRPPFSVIKVLSEMADQFRKSKQLKQTSSTNQEPAKPHEIYCDICTENKHKALKSCLVCLISYCETHLEPHQRLTVLKRHKLIDPVKNLEDYMCKKHDKPLELFCKTDHVCVCQFCTLLEHKSHQIVSLKEEYEGKKVELGKTVQKMIQERQDKIQEVQHSAELSKKDADREMAYSVQVFTAMISCIERSQAELIDVIEKKQKTTVKRAEYLIKELEQEITELKKRSSELKQLSHTEDHLHFLQNITSINTPPPTKDWTKVNVHQSSYGETLRTAVSQLEKTLEKTLGQEMKLCNDAELRRIQQYAVDVTLDPDTANPYLVLSEDGKQVCFRELKNNIPPIPDNTEKFTPWLSVLGKQRFSSGRFYYEVQVKDKTAWYLGVARESVNRKEGITPKGYWSLWLENGKCQAIADPVVFIPVREKLQTVGVFVDYEQGVVSFYDVEARAHIYSFTACSFTEKLCPFFNPHCYDEGKNSAPLIISPVNLID